MKKTKLKQLLAISVFYLLLAASEVSALGVGTTGKMNYTSFVGFGGLNVVDSNGNSQTKAPSLNTHTFTTGGVSYGQSKYWPVNCIDPEGAISITDNYKITEVHDATTSSLTMLGSLAIYDKAMDTCVIEGGCAVTTDTEIIIAQTVAIRTLFYLSGNHATYSDWQVNFYRSFGRSVIAEAGYELSTFVGYGFDKAPKTYYTITTDANTQSERIMSTANMLVKYALEVMNYKVDAYTSESEDTNSENTESSEDVEVKEKASIKENVEAEVEDKFDEDGNFVERVKKVKIVLVPTNIGDILTKLSELTFWTDVEDIEGVELVNNYASYTLDFADETKEDVTSNVSTDMLDQYLVDGDKIIIEFELKSEEDYCDEVKYYVDYKLEMEIEESEEDENSTEDENLETEDDILGKYNLQGEVYLIQKVSSPSGFQRFLMYNREANEGNDVIPDNHPEGDKDNTNDNSDDEDDSVRKDRLEGSIPVCDGGPEVEQEACPTDVLFPTDCAEVEDLEKGETLDAYINAPTDIKSCIINNEDEAGNSYVAGECAFDGLEENNYCTISCKEDYESISLSGIQEAISGKYFQIGLDINRTKSCYTSKIDTDKFEEDIDDNQNTVIESLNEYNMYYAMLNNITTYSNEILYDASLEQHYYMENILSYVPMKVVLSGIEEACGQTKSCTFLSYAIGYSSYPTSRDEGIANIVKYDNYDENSEVTSTDVKDEYYPTAYQIGSGKLSENVISTTANVYYLSDALDRKEELTELVETSKESLDDAQIAYAKALSDIKSCTEWEMTYDADPEIEYTFNEKYSSISEYKDSEDNMMDATTYEKSDLEINYCIGETNNEYTNCNTDTTEGDFTNSVETTDVKYTKCEFIDNSYVCSVTEDKVILVNYVKQTISVESSYDTPRVFYTAFPSGNIIYSNDSNDLSDLQVEVVDGLPIKLETGAGRYEYSFIFNNMGEYYDICETGRFLGETPEEHQGLLETLIEDFNSEYVCHYDVNCPNCTSTGGGGNYCPPNPDIVPMPEDGICETEDVDCPTCVFTETPNYVYRPVSTNGTLDNNSFDPNNRTLGYNWNTETEYEFLSAKAEETLYGENEDGIFGDNYVGYDGTPILKVTLTPDLASELRKINAESLEENNGGYSDSTLACDAYTVGDITYNYVLCYSTVLDSLLEDNYELEFATTSDRKSDDSYWTLADSITSTSIPSKSPTSVGGPSWK